MGLSYKKQYNWHKFDAIKRGVPFLFTYEEWLKIWTDSGYLSERGNKKGQYCMARLGDVGPYAVGNVKIILHSDNVVEGLDRRPKSEEHKRNMRKPKSSEHRAKLAKSNKSSARRRTRKLCVSQVLEIRRLYNNGSAINDLCKDFSVSNSTIWGIVTKSRWKNVL